MTQSMPLQIYSLFLWFCQATSEGGSGPLSSQDAHSEYFISLLGCGSSQSYCFYYLINDRAFKKKNKEHILGTLRHVITGTEVEGNLRINKHFDEQAAKIKQEARQFTTEFQAHILMNAATSQVSRLDWGIRSSTRA